MAAGQDTKPHGTPMLRRAIKGAFSALAARVSLAARPHRFPLRRELAFVAAEEGQREASSSVYGRGAPAAMAIHLRVEACDMSWFTVEPCLRLASRPATRTALETTALRLIRREKAHPEIQQAYASASTTSNNARSAAGTAGRCDDILPPVLDPPRPWMFSSGEGHR
ncbi:uncharacterized protein VTP21DRAFT_2491 [Calcarisporiella thermophila]|uniref:uncharacterized protein n=1 Tax=Calcarisporiella thermophila TaxID=911321 RepID=UPI00374281A4